MPEPLYSFPKGKNSLTYPIEENKHKTPRFDGQQFDYKNLVHLKYIADCTAAFNAELQALKALDRYLELSFAGWAFLKKAFSIL